MTLRRRTEENQNLSLQRDNDLIAHRDGTMKQLFQRNEIFSCIVSVKIIAVVLALLFFFVLFSKKHTDFDELERSNNVLKSNNVPSKDLARFENCTISSDPPRERSEWTTKPMWLPQYPDSLDDDIARNLIHQMTGMSAGAKSYYASSKNIRRCHGTTETATCSVVHPIVDMAGGPEAQRNAFSQQILLVLRNPRFAFPAHNNGKRIRYQHKEGQTPIEEWRSVRDEWFTHMVDEWKQFLKVWTSADGYKVGMYVVVEHLLDAEKGPDTALRLSDVLNSQGFPTLSPEDIPCIWYKSIGRETLETYRKYKYKFTGYVPSYTKEQQDILLQELSNLLEEYKENKELVAVLKEYYDDIRDNLKVDDAA